ncbi:MAG: hypothetical protein V2J10_09305 [Wenzhouxiangella sp.]|jgi:hypothetical protein|nr:hypothetical protein [Wenzhouxiangella sp.]
MRAINPAIAFALLIASQTAFAEDQTAGSGPYAIERYTVDTGGGVSSGGDFSVQGTTGQIDAGPTLIGNPYGIQGGFWPGLNGPAFIDRLFQDRFESNAQDAEESARHSKAPAAGPPLPPSQAALSRS